jgi:dTDP-4-dehydrorhamnose reductase
MTLRVLQFGATGALARELCARQTDAVAIRALSRQDVDLADSEAVARAVAAEPDVDLVLNAAAYTAVDRAESEPELAFAINARAPEAMARACRERGVPMVQVSTEMVFSGEKAGAYRESDPAAPLHVYGASKLAGEQAVLAAGGRALVLRVSWLFSAFGQNFLQTMLRLGPTAPKLQVVADQRARPTASGDVARFLLAEAARLAAAPEGDPAWGLTHFANAGVISRYEMAAEIFRLWPERAPAALEPVQTTAFPTPARRALNGELDCTRLERVFGVRPRPWTEALAEVVGEIRAAERRKVA